MEIGLNNNDSRHTVRVYNNFKNWKNWKHTKLIYFRSFVKGLHEWKQMGYFGQCALQTKLVWIHNIKLMKHRRCNSWSIVIHKKWFWKRICKTFLATEYIYNDQLCSWFGKIITTILFGWLSKPLSRGNLPSVWQFTSENDLLVHLDA